jgi:hypothetical protein
MRVPALLLLFVALVGSAAAADVRITRAFTGWRDAASFKRISEYFDGKENTGGQTLLRSHADQRGGYYFLVRAQNAGAARPATLFLQVITPTDSKTKTYTFRSELKAGDTVFNVGLTGDDWADPKANPVAWKIDLLGADGKVLATEKSYLWEKPGQS